MQNRLRTKLCENRDHFNFHIVKFPFICGTFPTTSAYEVYISQLIHNFRACGSYHGFLDRGLLPTRMLLYQGSLLLCCSHHIERPGSSVFYWFKRWWFPSTQYSVAISKWIGIYVSLDIVKCSEPDVIKTFNENQWSCRHLLAFQTYGINWQFHWPKCFKITPYCKKS